MPWRIVQQPNGLLARFSTIVDGFTHLHMTVDEAIIMCKEEMDMGEQAARNKVQSGIDAGVARWNEELETIRVLYGEAKLAAVMEEYEMLAPLTESQIAILQGLSTSTSPLSFADSDMKRLIDLELVKVIDCADDLSKVYEITAEGRDILHDYTVRPPTPPAPPPPPSVERIETSYGVTLRVRREGGFYDVDVSQPYKSRPATISYPSIGNAGVERIRELIEVLEQAITVAEEFAGKTQTG